MMGGDDLFLEGEPLQEELDLAVRWLRRQWRQGVVDVPERGVFSLTDPRLFPLGEAQEVFVYRDATSYDTWQRQGLTEAHASDAIWIARNPDGLSFVVDDRASPAGRMVQELMESLAQNRWQHLKTSTSQLRELHDAHAY